MTGVGSTSEAMAGTAAFAARLRRWLEAHDEQLEPYRQRVAGSVADAFSHDRGLLRLLADEGWSRHGWPTDVGGLGGSALLRGVLYDELAAAGVYVPEAFLLLETLAPMLQRFAPSIAARELVPFLRGEIGWCQGFSEPDAGSDLASLRTRATETDDGFVLNGQKIWVSFASAANRAAVLARTGTPESRHRGLTMLWVDLDLPGCEVRPIVAGTGRDEFGELFFDEVRVSRGALVGEIGQGWSVAMYLLQFERGMYAWQRQAFLLQELDRALGQAGGDALSAVAVGEAYLAATALRLRCRGTVAALADELPVGPETSVDKLLLGAAEQLVFDHLERALRPRLVAGDEAGDRAWRSEWLFARAATIYGGAAEVQRDIVAEHVLGLREVGRHGRS